MRNSLLIVIFSMLLAVGFSACKGDPCSSYEGCVPLAGFYNDTTPITVSGITIHGIGVPGDSIIIKDGTAEQVYLPLLAFKDTTAKYNTTCNFALIKDGKVDTITIDYTVSLRLYSPDCGIVYNNTIDSVSCTMNLLDSVTINDAKLTEANKVSLKIHFKK